MCTMIFLNLKYHCFCQVDKKLNKSFDFSSINKNLFENEQKGCL